MWTIPQNLYAEWKNYARKNRTHIVLFHLYESLQNANYSARKQIMCSYDGVFKYKWITDTWHRVHRKMMGIFIMIKGVYICPN